MPDAVVSSEGQCFLRQDELAMINEGALRTKWLPFANRIPDFKGAAPQRACIALRGKPIREGP